MDSSERPPKAFTIIPPRDVILYGQADASKARTGPNYLERLYQQVAAHPIEADYPEILRDDVDNIRKTINELVIGNDVEHGRLRGVLSVRDVSFSLNDGTPETIENYNSRLLKAIEDHCVERVSAECNGKTIAQHIREARQSNNTGSENLQTPEEIVESLVRRLLTEKRYYDPDSEDESISFIGLVHKDIRGFNTSLNAIRDDLKDLGEYFQGRMERSGLYSFLQSDSQIVAQIDRLLASRDTFLEWPEQNIELLRKQLGVSQIRDKVRRIVRFNKDIFISKRRDSGNTEMTVYQQYVEDLERLDRQRLAQLERDRREEANRQALQTELQNAPTTALAEMKQYLRSDTCLGFSVGSIENQTPFERWLLTGKLSVSPMDALRGRKEYFKTRGVSIMLPGADSQAPITLQVIYNDEREYYPSREISGYIRELCTKSTDPSKDNRLRNMLWSTPEVQSQIKSLRVHITEYIDDQIAQMATEGKENTLDKNGWKFLTSISAIGRFGHDEEYSYAGQPPQGVTSEMVQQAFGWGKMRRKVVEAA